MKRAPVFWRTVLVVEGNSCQQAGMICNLKTKTSVVAAANPRGGHYDLSKTVCENLKIALPLLSRFDLVFILLDSPDKQKDRSAVSKPLLLFPRPAHC
mmetsp:Transcript_24555/g.96963  ORF Transcript_24555/g.96963 Transcript_24555/m.96963 type:complete len:98 (+) Transcript_24555:1551-1844(+)